MYRWVVFLHVLGAFGFVLAHGVSVGVAIQLRRERSVERVRALLDLSSRSMGLMYGSLLLLLGAGLAAGFLGGWWGWGWIWAALGILLALLVAVVATAVPYYGRMREAADVPGRWERKRRGVPKADEGRLAELAGSSYPLYLAAIGVVSIVVILWLMMFKPF